LNESAFDDPSHYLVTVRIIVQEGELEFFRAVVPSVRNLLLFKNLEGSNPSPAAMAQPNY